MLAYQNNQSDLSIIDANMLSDRTISIELSIHGEESIHISSRMIFDDRNLEKTVKVEFLIGNVSSNNNENLSSELIFYQSPVFGQLYISDIRNIRGIQIFSLNGSIIDEITTVEPSLDVPLLRSGIYLLRVCYRSGKDTFHRIIKV